MGAEFIVAINIATAGLLATAFLLIAGHDKAYGFARCFAASYGLGMVNFAVEIAIPTFPYPVMAVNFGYAALLLGMCAFNVGLASMYRVPPPSRILIVAFVASMTLRFATQDMARESLLRMIAYQTPFALMMAIGTWTVLQARSADAANRVLAGLLALSGLHFLAKPWIALAAGGMGSGPQAYISSLYALISQATGTVLAFAVALLLLVILVRGLIADITAQSETDKLSGLFNRRGFELRLQAAIEARTGRGGMPLSLVTCDLDHFKQVNDTYGHASGDRVIAAFAAQLQSLAGKEMSVARVGGEEFAVILPGLNSPAARLFAETARMGFAASRVEGFEVDKRFTASFGVAQHRDGESMADFVQRADRALYAAKRAGRDCVRVAQNRIAGEDRRVGEADRRERYRMATGDDPDVTSRYLESSSGER